VKTNRTTNAPEISLEVRAMILAEDMGPVDFAVIEWPDRQPTGAAMPHLVALVDAGIVRLLDLRFMMKDDDGVVTEIEVEQMGADFEVFEGAASGLLDDEDLHEAANALAPGTSAALLIWENRWAAPFAKALRQGGAQLVADGRVPVQALLAAAQRDTVR
jgi:hypothetical protein